MGDTEATKICAPAKHSPVTLPPVPDLIPLDSIREKGCKRRHVRVMGEQRSARTSAEAAATAAAIDATSRRQRRKRSKSKTEDDDNDSDIITNMSHESTANPRVNPIFLWVRQEDTKIVDVKCEDYDKRNRILLTKTAHGWRAIPRMESLNTSATTKSALDSPRNAKRKKRHKKKRTKCKAIGIQVEEQCFKNSAHSDIEDINVESHIPSHTIHVNRKLSEDNPEAVADNSFSSMSSPLDKLLAVAELELKSVEDCNSTSFPDVEDVEKDESFLDTLVLEQTQSSLQMAGINYNELQGDYCDYNEEEDNTLVMDDILNRLEQSLGGAEQEITSIEPNNNNVEDAKEVALCVEQEKHEEHEDSVLCLLEEQEKDDQSVPCTEQEQEKHEEKEVEQTAAVETIEETIAAAVTACEDLTSKDDLDNILPTDLSCGSRRHCVSPPFDVPETIQSPEPSGIPAVTPDLCPPPVTSCAPVEEQPLNLVGKPRKSESPLVSCSEEIRVTSCTLKNDLITTSSPLTSSKDPTTEKTILEKTPFEQLEYILKHTKLRIPDPLLVPKDRLNVILTTPATEIPRLLFERPELKLPDALAFPHLLEDPDILVITVAQLQSILRKHFQTEKIEEYVLNKPPPEPDVTSTAKVPPTEPVKAAKAPTVCPPKQSTRAAKGNENPRGKPIFDFINSPEMQTNSIFNQWMWIPYLYQLETANNLLKTAGNPYGIYPPTYQYQNFPPNPPQTTPALAYQQELMKLSNFAPASPKKFKYSSLFPVTAPEAKQKYVPPAAYCFPEVQTPSSSYKHRGATASSRHYHHRQKVGNSARTGSGARSGSGKTVGGGGFRDTRQLCGVQQPMDLSSGSGGRFPINMSRLMAPKNAEVDVPEVGSTTSGLEEYPPGLQQHLCDTTHGQVGLWHPLFGK